MVYLSRIYTKTGDDGTTGLGDGTRVRKDDLRVEAYGTVDELNAVIGLMLATPGDLSERGELTMISNDLFDIGGDLCIPEDVDPAKLGGHEPLRVTNSQVERLEQAIDRLNDKLSPLRSFILPGGAPHAAWCHLARTICRKAERRVVTLSQRDTINPAVGRYLNRLSDYLFVLARHWNQDGQNDVLWKPGLGRGES